MSILASRLQNMRAKSPLDKYETRPSNYGALDLFMVQSEDPTGILSPEIRNMAKSSIGNVLEVPVIDKNGAITITNTRTVTVGDAENTTGMQSITFSTLTFGFTQVPSNFTNNEIGVQADFDAKLKSGILALADALDNAGITALAAAKTQVFYDPLHYATTGNKVQIPWKDRDISLGDMEAVMASNDYFEEQHVLANTGVHAMLRKLGQHGEYNDENKRMQYMDKIMHYSRRIPNEAGEYGNMYVVQAGSVGLLTRYEREAVLNRTMADGTRFSVEMLPIINLPVGTYYYESVGDNSALGGAATADNTRSFKQHFSFSVDVAFVANYNSDITTNANPILAATILDEAATDAVQVIITNPESSPVNTNEVV